jgi:AraC-like DNA-binding protein
MAGPAKVLDIALDCGFGDVSNFNRTFRAEFGVSPRIYRTSALGNKMRPRKHEVIHETVGEVKDTPVLSARGRLDEPSDRARD